MSNASTKRLRLTATALLRAGYYRLDEVIPAFTDALQAEPELLQLLASEFLKHEPRLLRGLAAKYLERIASERQR